MIHALNESSDKIWSDSHDNIGSGPISLPPDELHTSSTWYTFDVPVGIGLSEKIFDRWDELLKQAGMDMKKEVALLLQTMKGGFRDVL